MFALKVISAKQERDRLFQKPATKLILNASDYVRLARSMASELGFHYEETPDEEIIAHHYLKEFMGLKVICRFGADDGFIFQ